FLLEPARPAREVPLQEVLGTVLPQDELRQGPADAVDRAIDTMIPRLSRQLAEVRLRRPRPSSLAPQVTRLFCKFGPLLGAQAGMSFGPALDEQGRWVGVRRLKLMHNAVSQ